jgi:hypothetical protein
MNRRVRIIMGVAILAVSIALLVWSFRPLDRQVLTRPITPLDMQLPTPTSLLVPPELVS